MKLIAIFMTKQIINVKSPTGYTVSTVSSELSLSALLKRAAYQSKRNGAEMVSFLPPHQFPPTILIFFLAHTYLSRFSKAIPQIHPLLLGKFWFMIYGTVSQRMFNKVERKGY
jgi:hypothetical protein